MDEVSLATFVETKEERKKELGDQRDYIHLDKLLRTPIDVGELPSKLLDLRRMTDLS